VLRWAHLELLEDLRLAVRSLTKSPGLSALAVLTLGIGIGLVTAMFSVVNGAILRGLPFEDPGELMQVESFRPSTGARYLVTLHDLADWRERQTTFEGLTVWMVRQFTLGVGELRAERVNGAVVGHELFDLLRVPPLMGRGFERGDELSGSEKVVILSHALWANRFESDPAIVGRVMRVDGESRTVVGVMPAGFAFPVREDLWVPVDTVELPPVRGDGGRFFGFGRLRHGVTATEAAAELDAIARQLGETYPETNRGLEVVVGPYIDEMIGESLIRLTFAMLAAVFGVLLIACANVANLLLARAALRTREIAVHLALGAGRRRILRRLLAESFVLSCAGGMVGLLIARTRIDQFNLALQSAPTVPFWLQVSLDPEALLFVSVLTLAAGLLSGCLPAYQTSTTSLSEVLKAESRAASSVRMGRLARTLVVTEIALSCGLLVAAGLMIRTVVSVGRTDVGFATADVLTARVGLVPQDYPDADTQRRFYTELARRLRAEPGVASVALTSYFPGLGAGGYRFALEGVSYEDGESFPVARGAVIDPELFETLGARIVEGRNFLPSDEGTSTPVVIVNRSFAERYYPGASPVGRRLRFVPEGPESPWWTIVGVAPDLAMNRRRPGIGILEEDGAGLYLPFAQRPQGSMGIAIRSSRPPASLGAAVRKALSDLGPGEPLYDLKTLARAIEEQNVYYGVIAEAFSIFGASALVLACIGLYGVMAFSVNRRQREIGVRLAMGARGADVLRMVLRQGMIQLALGVVLGLVLSFLLTGTMGIMLFGVEPFDPVVFAGVVATLIATGCLATALPAIRASAVDPVVALRDE
jgi:putative ABC transport system permease protein